MMKLFTILLAIILLGCNHPDTNDEWEKLDLGEFTIEVPKGCEIEKIKSIDSYVAKIKGKGFELMFDYGRYSPKLVLTDEEYLKENEWKYRGENSILTIINPFPIVDKTEKINDSTYLITYNLKACLKDTSCTYHKFKNTIDSFYTIKDATFQAKYIIPSNKKNYSFILSDNDSIYKRIFIAKNQNKNNSGAYLLNKKSCEDEFNCTEQLSIWTNDSIRIDSNSLIKMFKSIKLK